MLVNRRPPTSPTKQNKMNTTILEVTLSRAHKIGERLKTRATELFAQAADLADSKSVQPAQAATQAKKIKDHCIEVLRLHTEGERWTAQLVNVRNAVSVANSERGINTMLTTMEGFNRVLAQKKALVEKFNIDDMGVEELDTVTAPVNPSAYDRALSVRVLTAEAKSGLDREIGALQRKVFALADSLAEANAGRVKLHLDEDVASQVTGA